MATPLLKIFDYFALPRVALKCLEPCPPSGRVPVCSNHDMRLLPKQEYDGTETGGNEGRQLRNKDILVCSWDEDDQQREMIMSLAAGCGARYCTWQLSVLRSLTHSLMRAHGELAEEITEFTIEFLSPSNR